MPCCSEGNGSRGEQGGEGRGLLLVMLEENRKSVNDKQKTDIFFF